MGEREEGQKGRKRGREEEWPQRFRVKSSLKPEALSSAPCPLPLLRVTPRSAQTIAELKGTQSENHCFQGSLSVQEQTRIWKESE